MLILGLCCCRLKLHGVNAPVGFVHHNTVQQGWPKVPSIPRAAVDALHNLDVQRGAMSASARLDIHDERNWNGEGDAIVGTSDEDSSDEEHEDGYDYWNGRAETERQEQEDEEYDDYDDSDATSEEEDAQEDIEEQRAKIINRFAGEARLEAMCSGFVAVPTAGWHYEWYAPSGT